MAARHVYRRPHAIQRRRFVPQTFAAHHVVVRRRAAQHVRRRHIQLRRRPRVLVPPTFAATAAPVLRRRQVHRLRRALQQRRALVFGVTPAAAGTGAVHVAHRRSLRRLPRPIRRRPGTPGSFQVPQPVIPSVPIIRLHKAIARIRRSLQARLRWKPRPEEIPPIFAPERIEQAFKGTLAAPGLVRGRIVGGG